MYNTYNKHRPYTFKTLNEWQLQKQKKENNLRFNKEIIINENYMTFEEYRNLEDVIIDYFKDQTKQDYIIRKGNPSLNNYSLELIWENWENWTQEITLTNDLKENLITLEKWLLGVAIDVMFKEKFENK